MPVRGQQARALARYLQRQVRAYSAHYRPVLERAFKQRGGRSGVDLGAIPTTRWSDVTDPRTFVLRPDYESISAYGEPILGLRVLFARLMGASRTAKVNRTYIDPAYKPIHWDMAGGVPIGSSAHDLERLTELGRRWLEDAGVRFADVLVSIVPPGPNLAYTELVLGSRRSGLSAVFLPDDAPFAQVARLHPTVLAGRPDDLDRLLSGAADDLASVHTVLAVGEPLGPWQRARLEASLPADAQVLSAWAPPGVRSLWTECRGQTGLHTWPSGEVLEVVDGEVLWTAIGWSGTVFVRLHTGVMGTVKDTVCKGCRRATPRVVADVLARETAVIEDLLAAPSSPDRESAVADPEPEPAPAIGGNGSGSPFASVLDGHPGISAWQAELRRVGSEEELLVFFSTAGDDGAVAVLGDLGPALPVTQFVVLPEVELRDRLARHDDRRVVDLR